MSLVNDALRKARAEATRQDASRADFQLPLLERSSRRQRRPKLTPAARTLVSLAAALIGAVLVVFWLLRTVTPGEEGQVQARAGGGETLVIGADSAGPDRPTAAGGAEGVTAVDATPATPETTTPATDSRRDVARIPPRRNSAVVAPAEPPEPAFKGEPRSGQTSIGNSAAPASSREAPAVRPAPAESTSPNAQQLRPQSPIMSSIPAEGAGRNADPTPDEPAGESAADRGPETDAGSAASSEAYLREAEIPGIGMFRLDGIAWSTDQPFALLNGEVVGRGGFVDGLAVADITPDRVVLVGADRRFVIRLR
ncbi:MAG: hypothetical protein OEM62_01755 [Acidobacteriota bacterium]|nr:hypothetical protein [Acidobacteriota bacterium]